MDVVAEKGFGLQKVEIERSRWRIVIRITEYGEVSEYIASADSFFSEGSSIWFGTKEEYDEFYERNC